MNLDSSITELTRLTHVQRAALARLGINTIRDLLYHIPHRYESSADVRTIAQAHEGHTVTIYGQFSKLEMRRSFKTKVPMAEGTLEDGTGKIRIVWFHQPYLAKMVPVNELVRVRGTVTASNGRKYIANPVVEKAAGIPFMDTHDGLMPVYPESAGITSLWFYHAVKRAFEEGVLTGIEETLPENIL